MVGGEEDAVRDPVAAAEGAVHAWQEQPAEEQLLAEYGVEEEEDEDEAIPAPGAAEEVLNGL